MFFSESPPANLRYFRLSGVVTMTIWAISSASVTKPRTFRSPRVICLSANHFCNFVRESARFEELVAEEQHVLVRIVSRKQALVQKAFTVPDVVGDLRVLLLGAEAAVFDLHGDDFFRKRAF